MIRLRNYAQFYVVTCLKTWYKSLNVLTEYTSNPVISLYLSICSGGSWGGAQGGPPPFFWVKKSQKEEKQAGQAKTWAPSLAQGLDPPLICITEALLASAVRCQITVEPRFNEVAGDRPNVFVKSRVCYIENLDITNLRGNDQNVRYIEVIGNDWFVTQVTSVTQFNAIFVTQKCRVLRCNSIQYQLFSLLRRRAAFFHKGTTLPG